MRKLLATNLVLFFIVSAFFAPLRLRAQKDFPTEVFQVLDLPLAVHDAALVKSDKGYLLRLTVANSAELKMIGLRYSLITINSDNQPQIRVNRTEGFSLAPYKTKSLTFNTPIKLKPKDGERLVLMLEQVVSRESIWEVVKAKDALEAYARGDFSVMPAVMRVANAVDSPPDGRLPTFRQE
ncbi:MAG TPA: hypothetical protein VFP64_09900 [Pyrinomonadaceae bacterium]|nr:hypothetical protein [Pyrinomonadaceae bacterium]